MNWRKHMILAVGGGVAALLLLGAIVLLLRFQGQYGAVSSDLRSALDRVQQLNNRDPFPSTQNIAIVRGNLETLEAATRQLQETLQRGQLEGDAIEPAEFAPLLERVTKRLMSRADESGVALPEKINLGFARYAAGELPVTSAIPRLVVQLKAVEAICGILFQSRVSQLISIEREVFEGSDTSGEDVAVEGRRRRVGTSAAPAAPSLPPPATNDLYVVERLNVSFTARETAAWDVLNALTRAPLFLAVVDLQMENVAAAAGDIGKKRPPAPIGTEQAIQQGTARYPSHDERVVAGRELVRVNIVIDLYRFASGVMKEEAR